MKPVKKPLIMGILNVTPDSFSDGGKFFDPNAALAQAEKMAAEGADILDIGGESTRPFSDSVTTEEESRRVIPIIEAISHRLTVPISIDTTKSEVARRAVDAGATIINDISALRLDPGIADVAAESGSRLILMHMQGTPKNMQVAPRYSDLFGEVIAFLQDAVATAVDKGVAESNVIVDPGIGFGKTIRHNLMLLKDLERLQVLGRPILIGLSRKAFIRKIVKPDHLEDIDPLMPIVETGTHAAVAAAVLNGADIVRVHDVAGTHATIKILHAISSGEYPK